MTDESSPPEGDRIGGSYPGGPSRKEEGRAGDGGRRPDLTRAEDIEARAQDGHRARVRKRRRKRVAVGFVVAVVVAAAAGFWMGVESHRTADEIAAEEEQRQRSGFDFGAESDRLLQQLWLMEDLERARNP